MTFADDAGEYSIFAKNPHGEASASTSLLEEGTSILFFVFCSFKLSLKITLKRCVWLYLRIRICVYRGI